MNRRAQFSKAKPCWQSQKTGMNLSCLYDSLVNRKGLFPVFFSSSTFDIIF